MPRFSEQIRKRLLSNPNVESVSGSRVAYTLEFKLEALKSFADGMTSKQIFIKAGIDLSLFRFDYAKNTIRRWKRIGPEGLKLERRGSSSHKNHTRRNLSPEQEIAQLKAEIWILKKLQASAKNRKK